MAAAYPEEVVHMAEVMALEWVALEGAVTEGALEARSVDQKVADMAAEETDTAMDLAELQRV